MKKLRITVEGRPYDVTVEVLSDNGVASADPAPAVSTQSAPATAVRSQPAAPAAAAAPAPAKSAKPPAAGGKEVASQVSGVVVSVEVKVGDNVTEGQKLVTIEAMKMNTYVMAPSAGTVSEILAAKGNSVLTGDVLVRLT